MTVQGSDCTDIDLRTQLFPLIMEPDIYSWLDSGKATKGDDIGVEIKNLVVSKLLEASRSYVEGFEKEQREGEERIAKATAELSTASSSKKPVHFSTGSNYLTETVEPKESRWKRFKRGLTTIDAEDGNGVSIANKSRP